MKVIASKAGKRFHPKWIFRDVSFMIGSHSRMAITGKNGSGKSTLLQIIAAFITPTSGQITWELNGNNLHPEQIYRHISLASPYIELIEDFTLPEIIRFHGKFKAFHDGLSHEKLIGLSGLGASIQKPIRQYSSGMKQRLKLLLAIASRSDLLLLDEPCSNLDAQSVAWYHDLMDQFASGRTIVIASNNKPEEYPGIDHVTELG